MQGLHALPAVARLFAIAAPSASMRMPRYLRVGPISKRDRPGQNASQRLLNAVPIVRRQNHRQLKQADSLEIERHRRLFQLALDATIKRPRFRVSAYRTEQFNVPDTALFTNLGERDHDVFVNVNELRVGHLRRLADTERAHGSIVPNNEFGVNLGGFNVHHVLLDGGLVAAFW